jgi:hypothetical protein
LAPGAESVQQKVTNGGRQAVPKMSYVFDPETQTALPLQRQKPARQTSPEAQTMPQRPQ